MKETHRLRGGIKKKLPGEKALASSWGRAEVYP